MERKAWDSVSGDPDRMDRDLGDQQLLGKEGQARVDTMSAAEAEQTAPGEL